MRHVVELGLIVMFMAVGHSVVSTTPRVVLRTARNVALWWLVFGAAVTVLFSPIAATWAVRVGGVLLAAYFARWLIGYVVDAFHGPRLFDVPDAARLAFAVAAISGMGDKTCLRFSWRIRRKYDGDLALLGLIGLEEAGCEDAENFEVAWDAACAGALEKARSMALKYAQKAGHDRLNMADIAFLAQMLCLYDQNMLERGLTAMKRPGLGRRSARARFAKRMMAAGRMRDGAQSLRLVAAVGDGEEDGLKRLQRMPVKHMLCPALGFAELGFGRRALVISLLELTLVAYALLCFLAVVAEHRLGWNFLWNNSGGVFFAAWILVHVEAMFALGDFDRLARYLKESGVAANGE